MTTGVVSIENCPRDMEGLLSLQRGIRYRLGIQTQLFKNEAEEQAFLGATDQVQAETLLAHLQQFDAGAVQQTAAVQPPPTQIALPPAVQQPVTPTAQPTAMQMPAGPQMPAVVPPTMPQPQPIAAPPQAAPAAPVMAPPQVAMPAMPAPPAPPAAPVVPAAPAAPATQPKKKGGKKPSTASDPTNAGSKAMDTQFQQQLAKVLKELSGVSATQADSIEDVREQLAGMTRILTTILSVQLVMAEQAQIDRDMLAKCIKAMGDTAPEDFLGLFEETEEG